MTTLTNAASGAIIAEVAAVIVANKVHLSQIDGLIGDGDHGVNMAKGFGRTAERMQGRTLTLSEAMTELADVLIAEIGGSMGPLYGMMFTDMADSIAATPVIDADAFGAMLRAGRDGVQAVGSAEVGDKTMLDCLVPAVSAYDDALAQGGDFAAALEAMQAAAVVGRDSTVNLVARVGRSARLGERSRGVVDAGATSCCLILHALADGALRRMTV